MDATRQRQHIQSDDAERAAVPLPQSTRPAKRRSKSVERPHAGTTGSATKAAGGQKTKQESARLPRQAIAYMCNARH
eukprot:8136641-Alexandrium_andersonii.AAC.1